MSSNKPTPMTRDAASRVQSAAAKQNGGRIPAGNFGSRADAAVQRGAGGGKTGNPGKR